jgi:hypothetical protein
MLNPEANRRRGLLAMSGTLLWVVTGLLVDFTGGGGTRAEAILRTVLLNPALLLLMAGLVGFHKRQAKRSGRLGAAGSAICLLGSGIMLLGNIAEIWVYKYLYGILEARWTLGWWAMGIGLAILPAGFLLLGIATFRAEVFTGWRRAVPFGFGLLLTLIGLAVAMTGIGSGLVVFYGFAIGWAAFGYALWSEKTEGGEDSASKPG